MSIGADPVSSDPISGQTLTTTTTSKPPPKRQAVAKADSVAQPEPR